MTRACTARLSSFALLLISIPAVALKPHHVATGHPSIRHGSTRVHAAYRAESRRSFESMPSERATEIQTALIKKGYLTGEPSGTWDAQSVAAMQKLQGDNGWQTKITPDSRALIKLGLGPHADQPQTAQPQATQSQVAQPQVGQPQVADLASPK